MWRAAEAPVSKRPSEWLRHKQAQEFGEFLAENLGVGNSHSALVRSDSGGVGGSGSTWAHWQLAMAYAKYLSPEFHAWCNEVVRAVMQGRAPAFDARALLGEALKQIVPALITEIVPTIMTAVDQRIDARVGSLSFGVIRPWELGSIKRRLSAAADRAVLAKAYRSRKSALAGLTMRLRTAIGWTGTGATMNRMPASMLPYAERELAAIEREFERTFGQQGKFPFDDKNVN